MPVWGISALTHDASISVIEGNEILFAAHAERFSKVKNDPYLNDNIIRAALEYGQPEYIVWFENRWLKKWRQFKHLQWKYLLNLSRWPKQYLKNFGLKQEIIYVDHHASHAAAGFLTSEFEDACIICIDALGEENTITIWGGLGSRIYLIDSIKYPHSLGMLYTAFTKRCGFKPNEEEYILMGMAAYGKPIYKQQIFNEFIKKPVFALKKNVHKGIGNWMPNAKVEDLAASMQSVFEDTLYNICQKYQCNSKNVVFMGGSALNCKANHILHQFFNKVWIMPNPGDAGSSLGCAAYEEYTKLNWRGPYLGTDIGGPYPVEELYEELIKGNVVGVANGRAEFGPRALGNRSLLADPRNLSMKDKVNEIKKRQKFRPFAPVIMEEFANEYFDFSDLNLKRSPYMQYTLRCKYPKDFPAIVHVDGTSRVQTVSEKQNAGLYRLLRLFHAKTGCPMLLNTSLNIRGKPMVNDENDAKLFEKTYNIKVF